MMLAMSGATPQDAGLASGLVNTTGQVGGAIGLALLATISTERTAHLLDAGESQAQALLGGYHVAWLIGAGLAIVAVAVAVLVLRQQALPEMAHGAAPDGEPDRAPEPAYESA
jgi:hypothetical protein